MVSGKKKKIKLKTKRKSVEKTTDEKYENVLHYVPLIFMLMALGFR